MKKPVLSSSLSTPSSTKKVIKAEVESDDDVPLSVRAATLTKKRKKSESDDEDYKLEVSCDPNFSSLLIRFKFT